MSAGKRTMASRPTVQFLIDTHFTPSSSEVFEDFSASRIIEGLQTMGVDSVMFQAKCARGLAYYDSKIVPRHPNLKRDIIAPLVRDAKKAGMEVFLYTCVTSDFYCATHFPDMWLLDQNGRPYADGVVCVNGPYRARYLAIMDELSRKFSLDGVFVDGPESGYGSGTVWPTPCYCEACKALWRKRYGQALPLNAQKVCRERLVEFLDDSCRTFVAQTMDALRAHRPKARLWHNASCPTESEDEAYHEVDAYHRNFYRPSLFMKRHRAVCGDIPRVYSLTMDKPVRHAQSKEMIAWEIATYLAHQTVEVVVWSTPDLQTMWYAPEMEKKLQWAIEQTNGLRDEMADDMTVISDLSIGFSRNDLVLNLASPPENNCRDDLSGAHRLLAEAQIPFDVVDLDKPLSLGRTGVLMVNAIKTLPPRQVKAILDWVRKGGKLIGTGSGALVDALPGLQLGPVFTVTDTSTFAGRTPVAYCKPDWRPEGDAWSIMRGFYPVLKHDGWKVLAGILPQAVYRSGEAFDISHRPSSKSSGPGVLYRKLGKGGVVYFNHEVFADSIDRGVNLFRDIPAACLRQLGVQPRFEMHGCHSVEANYYKTRKGVKIVLTNGSVGLPVVANGEPSPWAEMNEVVKVADITITSHVPYARARSRQLGELEVNRQPDGVATIRLPKLAMWDVIHLEELG